jgi:universal stress protein A
MKPRSENKKTSRTQSGRYRGTRVQGQPSAKAVVGWLRRRRPLRRGDVETTNRIANPTAPLKRERSEMKAGPTLQFSRVLIPIDFSAESTRALKTAANLGLEGGRNLLLVHVVGPIYDLRDYGYGPVQRRRPDQGMMRHARQRLQALGRRHLGPKRQWRCVVRSGTAPRQILKAAEEFRADLLIMPTRGLSHAPATEVGSTAERVVRHAPCPVLVVPKRTSRKG